MRIMKKNRRFVKITAAVLPAVMLVGAVSIGNSLNSPRNFDSIRENYSIS